MTNFRPWSDRELLVKYIFAVSALSAVDAAAMPVVPAPHRKAANGSVTRPFSPQSTRRRGELPAPQHQQAGAGVGACRPPGSSLVELEACATVANHEHHVRLSGRGEGGSEVRDACCGGAGPERLRGTRRAWC